MALLSVKELAADLGIKPGTLYAWAKRDKIPCLKIHGLLRFDQQEIARWLQSFRREGPGPGAVRPAGRSSRDIDLLVERARREVYSTRHGETTPTSSLKRKEGKDGAL